MDLSIKSRIIRFSAISGFLASCLYISLILILSETAPGYNHLSDTISMLGQPGPEKLPFQIGGVFTGIIIVLFAYGLHLGINYGKGSLLGPVFIMMSGLGLIGVSLFLPQHMTHQPLVNLTVVKILHLLFASLAVSGAGFSPFFLYSRFKLDYFWKNWQIYSIIAGILSNLPSVIILIGFLTSSLLQFLGLLEKLSVLIPLLWLLPISVKLYHSSFRIIGISPKDVNQA